MVIRIQKLQVLYDWNRWQIVGDNSPYAKGRKTKDLKLDGIQLRTTEFLLDLLQIAFSELLLFENVSGKSENL